MAKSLTDIAKGILLKEGQVPSVSSSDNSPDRDAKSSNANMATLKPKSKTSEADPKHNEATDLGGATPTSTAKDNLGAKAAAGVSKDKSKAGIPVVGPEQNKSLSEDEGKDTDSFLDEEIEMTEELEAFIAEKVAAGLSEEEIAEAIAENFEIVEEKDCDEDDEDDEDDKKEDKGEDKKEKKIDMKEHVDALLAGENLSEDFRTKATTIFESAVLAKVNEEVSILEEAYANALEEQVARLQTEQAEKIDDYLNYIVEQWVKDNEVAIETGLRTELTEDFISGLRNLFSEHYIDIPEDKVSIVEELGQKVQDLESKLNEEIDRNVGLVKQINEAKQFEIFVEACEGLTDTQAEKLKALAENVEFTTAEDFATKLQTLKESYFATPTSKDTALDKVASDQSMLTESLSPRMEAYVRALGRTVK